MASSFFVTGSAVKTKWQYLRDTYCLELAKINQSTGLASGNDSKWKFFQQMSFLHDIYAPRYLVGNVPYPQESDADDALVSGASPYQIFTMPHIYQQLGEQESDEQQLVEQQTGESSCYSKLRQKIDQIKDALHDLVKVAHLQEMKNKEGDIEEDEDYFFVMSLLPHIRAIPQSQKLQMSIKLQQVLLECQSTNQNSTSYHNTSIPKPKPSDYFNGSSSFSTSLQQITGISVVTLVFFHVFLTSGMLFHLVCMY